jgi:tol-pal system protein YbgF
MATSRLGRAAGFGLAAVSGLLVACSFCGCGFQREFVRRGQVLDSLSVRMVRMEQAQAVHEKNMVKLRADLMTEIEGLSGRLDQIDAQFGDLGDRLDRISRRVGAGRGDITPVGPDTTAQSDTAGKSATVRTPLPGPDTSSGAEDQLYNTAYLDFTRGKYDVAIGEFRQFIGSFPTSDNADNAQYWVGECFYSLNRLDSAEVNFRQVMTSYPKGNKVPAAEYKLGLVYLSEGRKPEGRNQLERVVHNYPGTNEAKLAGDRLRSLE